jgi:hypothetical protein
VFEINSANDLVLLELRTLKRSLTIDFRVFKLNDENILHQDKGDKLFEIKFISKNEFKFTYQLSLSIDALKKLAYSELYNSNATLFKDSLVNTELSTLSGSGFEIVLLDIFGNISKEKFYFNV